MAPSRIPNKPMKTWTPQGSADECGPGDKSVRQWPKAPRGK